MENCFRRLFDEEIQGKHFPAFQAGWESAILFMEKKFNSAAQSSPKPTNKVRHAFAM